MSLLALFLAASIAAHVCVSPPVALYGESLSRDMTSRELASMDRYSGCLCGPDGATDWDPRPEGRGRWRLSPSCNRDGWNGRAYRSRR